MKTDRELLELAAKAAGIQGKYSETIGEDWGRYAGKPGIAIGGGQCWNPLSDDGDAMRLAVKLGMLAPGGRGYAVFQWLFRDELLRDLRPSEAARRAIVRAAAEIGEVQS